MATTKTIRALGAKLILGIPPVIIVRAEVVLRRLHIGHKHFTHHFILGGSSAPVCVHCDRLLSVEYIMVHCSKFLDQRRRYCLDDKFVDVILGDEVV